MKKGGKLRQVRQVPKGGREIGKGKITKYKARKTRMRMENRKGWKHR